MTKEPNNVLVVDDQKSWCEVVAVVLEDAGLSARFARSYDEATAVLSSQDIDLVIVDIRLQEAVAYNVEGIDLLQWIHEHKQGLPAVVLTGHGTPALHQKALWYGAHAFLEKTDDEAVFDRDHFLKAIRQALGIGSMS